MENDKILNKNYEKKPFYRPSYYMKPINKDSKNKLEYVSSIKKIKFGEDKIPISKTYRLDLDKIKTLEDVKKILGALNIEITIKDGIISDNKYDMNILMKYMDIEENNIDANKVTEIKMEFDNGVYRLVGNELGKAVYKEQLEKNIDYSKKNILLIPDYIEDISISFVQGLTEEIFRNINKDEFEVYFKLKGNKNVIEKFMKLIYL